jgi:subtilisin family serine protease
MARRVDTTRHLGGLPRSRSYRSKWTLPILFFAAVCLIAGAMAFVSLGTSPAPVLAGSGTGSNLISVIVQEEPSAGDVPDQAVATLGGRITAALPIVNGFAALLPESAVDALRATAGVLEVTANATLHLSSATTDQNTQDAQKDKKDGPGWKADTAFATMNAVTKLIGAQDLWASGVTGRGVGIALIDSGVVQVGGLQNQVIIGPDLSFESQSPAFVDLDTFGHGTHLAGIMAGSDGSASLKKKPDPSAFTGVAPEAKIISVKVASYDGATDVSQVLAAIDWVVQHRNDPGLNIRVLNLSFGTDSTQDYRIDPLAYAVEVAWRHGIVVVVAAGNEGNSGRLNDPAVDPYVIAVGAEDMNGTPGSGDDLVPDWSSRGNAQRSPDLVAPGKSILSLRNPGSWIDVNYPDARVNDRFFRGSGTSQATAVVAGAAALLIQQRPNLTPDQVKALLISTANRLPKADRQAQGAGLIDLKSASKARVPSAVQSYPLSGGTGSLEAARGTSHVADDGVEIYGEVDIFGQAWDGRSWSGRSWSGTSWEGDSWMGRSWSGVWEGMSWAGRSWSGRSWSDTYWDGRSWSGRSWSGRSWSGRSWSGRSWSGHLPQ